MRSDLEYALDALCLAQRAYDEGKTARRSIETCKDQVVVMVRDMVSAAVAAEKTRLVAVLKAEDTNETTWSWAMGRAARVLEIS